MDKKCLTFVVSLYLSVCWRAGGKTTFSLICDGQKQEDNLLLKSENIVMGENKKRSWASSMLNDLA